MSKKSTTPKAPKQPKAKKAKKKPAWAKIETEKLEALEIAKKTLADLIKAKKAADQAEVEYEIAADEQKARKGALLTAKLKIKQIIEAYERPLPLFPNKDEPPKDAKPADQGVLNAVTIKVVKPHEDAQFMNGRTYHPVRVAKGGLFVMAEDRERDLLIDEYEIVEGADLVHKFQSECTTKDDTAQKWFEFLAANVKLPEPEAAKVPPASAAWRAQLIADLGIEGKLEKSLDDSGLGTIGALRDAMLAKPESWWKDVKGVGAEMAVKAGDAMNKWVGEHPELFPV